MTYRPRIVLYPSILLVVLMLLLSTVVFTGGCLTDNDSSEKKPTNGGITGLILDGNGAPALQITVRATMGTATYTTVTGSNGRYEFQSLAAGTYAVTPEHAFLSFAPSAETVTVTGGGSSEAPFTMKLTCAVAIETTLGTFACELDYGAAPVTVANFMVYVSDGFYSDMIFHRVIGGFIIQGGGYTVDMGRRITHPSIVCESNNGLSNLRGTVAMARIADPNSATSQFFINLANNTNLDYTDDTDAGRGYAVFGRVTSGMDVVDTLGAVETVDTGQFDYLPVEQVVIISVELMRDNQAATQ